MLFNSFEFLVFLPLVFVLYWFVFNKNVKAQNTLVLLASYYFYAWWDYRFLLLLILSTIVDYFIGLAIWRSESEATRKYYLLGSVFFNLGVLGYFKYSNFFIESWQDLLRSIGYEAGINWNLNIILPVGISFYTFQTLSYSIDIYRKKLEPTKDFISFAGFVSFFPQLVAGPIERATNLLPQILNKRTFKYDQGVQGLRLILWGMFKKIVIADSLAPYVNDIFSSPESHGGGTLFMGAVYFSFQLYADFSGYSDIAIGTAKLLGVELMSNFKFPIFTKDVVEVWSKWHISLTTWFRDYVFKSMGGIRVGRSRLVFNIFIVFMVSGLWHGAHWKYVVWGWVHALLFVITLFLRKNIKITSDSRILINSFNGLKTLLTLCLLCLTFVLFRAGDLSDALFIYSRILFDLIHFKIGLIPEINQYLIFISIITLFDYLFRKDERNLFQFGSIPRRLSYFFMLLGILIYLNNENNFFYFQF